jgi:hypothetical protein
MLPSFALQHNSEVIFFIKVEEVRIRIELAAEHLVAV